MDGRGLRAQWSDLLLGTEEFLRNCFQIGHSRATHIVFSHFPRKWLMYTYILQASLENWGHLLCHIPTTFSMFWSFKTMFITNHSSVHATQEIIWNMSVISSECYYYKHIFLSLSLFFCVDMDHTYLFFKFPSTDWSLSFTNQALWGSSLSWKLFGDLGIYQFQPTPTSSNYSLPIPRELLS